MLGYGCVDHPVGAEFLEQALAHLVGALVLGDLLAQQEDVGIAPHLLGHGVPQGFAYRDLRHRRPPSDVRAFGHVVARGLLLVRLDVRRRRLDLDVLHEDVGHQFLGLRLGAGLRELGRLGDLGLDLLVDLLEAGVVGRLALGDDGADVVDRVVFGPHLLDLVLGAILGRVRHGMAAIAVGLHLDQHRPLAGAAVGDRLLRRGIDLLDIHAVDLDAGDAEGLAPLVEFGAGLGPFDRGAHGVLVVLDHEHGGQLPQARHVEGFVDLALVGRTLTEEDHRDVVALAVLVGKGDAGAERDLGADDAVAAVEALLQVEDVHRSALALGDAAGATGQLGHDGLGRHAADQRVAVAAVAGDDRILGPDGVIDADNDGFLADVEMAEPSDQAHAIHLADLLFEAADQQHLAVEIQEELVGDHILVGVRLACLRLRGGPGHDISQGSCGMNARHAKLGSARTACKRSPVNFQRCVGKFQLEGIYPLVEPRARGKTVAHDHDLVGPRVVQDRAGTLLEHVAVETLRPHQLDMLLKRVALGGDGVQLDLRLVDLMLE